MNPRSFPALGRRRFLALGGAGAAGLVIAGCGDDGEMPAQTQPPPQREPMQQGEVTLDFSTPIGVLNYAFALENLESAFYAMANAQLYDDASEQEMEILTAIGAHEQVHVDFLGAVLGDDALQGLEVNFEMVDFGNRDSVFQTALTFENLGVGAYNGAAKYLAVLAAEQELAGTALQAAGDIVAVEARHASIIGAEIAAGQDEQFAPTAFDEALEPMAVIEAAQPFIRQQVAVTNADFRQQGG